MSCRRSKFTVYCSPINVETKLLWGSPDGGGGAAPVHSKTIRSSYQCNTASLGFILLLENRFMFPITTPNGRYILNLLLGRDVQIPSRMPRWVSSLVAVQFYLICLYKSTNVTSYFINREMFWIALGVFKSDSYKETCLDRTIIT